MVNINKLKGKIVERGMSVGDLAKEIGVDRSTLYRKMNASGEPFTIREANLICKALKLSGQEAMAIFFSDCVA
ncbi:helix-turn-helix domain-containing protein [Desulfofalx alkaliphila]|uniref:helix-turn-helix domain-containing protein n=1 Tax=Desulfofalx alkaliphila TaxID=105483 RepID=UPI0004E26D7B|nr:helix-turn-helix transcriptional regulator [Desulfofalx alkaliphila]